MGIISSKERKKVSEATSNSSLSNLRYVITEKPKWKVFKKREVQVIPAYTALKPQRGCPCGNNGTCKQKVTPNGVTIHYPRKKRKPRTLVGRAGFKPAKTDKALLNTSTRPPTNVKLYRPKRFPTWRLDKITYNTPYMQSPAVRPSP